MPGMAGDSFSSSSSPSLFSAGSRGRAASAAESQADAESYEGSSLKLIRLEEVRAHASEKTRALRGAWVLFTYVRFFFDVQQKGTRKSFLVWTVSLLRCHLHRSDPLAREGSPSRLPHRLRVSYVVHDPQLEQRSKQTRVPGTTGPEEARTAQSLQHEEKQQRRRRPQHRLIPLLFLFFLPGGARHRG